MLNEKLREIEKNINLYISNNEIKCNDKDEAHIVLDIESCKISDNEALTYSVALMCVNDDNNICYLYKTVEETLEHLFNLEQQIVNIYIHNAYFDIKPFLTVFCEKYNGYQNSDEIKQKEVYNIFKHKKEKINVQLTNTKDELKEKNSYDICFKNGIFYQAKFYGDLRKDKFGRETHQQLRFRDTLKIAPFSLKKCSKDFLNLELSKDGLDYNKIRSLDDELTIEELKYIYEDVFSLKYLVKLLIVDGININGKEIKYYKITNSSQSLYDYKLTLLEDFKHRENCFKNTEFFEQIDTLLTQRNFYKYDDKEKIQAEILFNCVYPELNPFIDSWIRNSYYGGLAMVDFENVNKYSKYENKIGQVFDVNSLYPYIMLDRLLPVGRPQYGKKPYEKMSKKYKETFPLYIQKITIYDMKLKEGKTAFVQVKNRSDFNGRETIKENINKSNKKVKIDLYLCNPLLELLFDNYNVKSYKLGEHFAFQGQNDLFKNYLDFWGNVKKNSKGTNRAIAKLRQNALYGKFGTNPTGEMLSVFSYEGKWTVEKVGVSYVTDNIYLPISTFITSYAKQYLVNSINENRYKFLYCDTDSLHVFGKLEEIKGLKVDSKEYGAWKHELTFIDFKYLGAKRYAEKNIKDGKWDIKCCGLTNEIMQSIDDIETFEICKHTSKEINNMKLYTKDTDYYYYYDKDCTQKVKGLYKSKKAKIVKNGTLILECPYMLSINPFSY